MALQLPFGNPHCEALDACYARIYNFGGDKVSIAFNVCYYLDKYHREMGGAPHAEVEYHIATASITDLMADIYLFLKALPEFAGALDV